MLLTLTLTSSKDRSNQRDPRSLLSLAQVLSGDHPPKSESLELLRSDGFFILRRSNGHEVRPDLRDN